jgi:hypothetical protein
MYLILYSFLTGFIWGLYRGRLISEWKSYQAKLACLVLCWVLTAGAVFLLLTCPLTWLGCGIAVLTGGFGTLIGYRSQGNKLT